MDNPSGPEQPSPEPTYIRPPGIEFGRGVATFSLVFAVFAMAQMVLLIQQVMSRTPTLAGQGFSFSMLQDDAFQESSRELITNGDVVAIVSLGAGLMGLMALALLVLGWKKARTTSFLAMQLPRLRPFLAWTGFFVIFFVVLESLANFLPDMDSGFMKQILGSVTNYPLLILGVGIMPALFEEFLLRGLLYGSLRYLLDKHASIAIISGLFALVHPQYEWYVQLFYVLPMGIFFGYARAHTGSIWTGVFLHLLNNCVSIFLPQG
ncbi:MAG TPA: CPBP family intramembrane glutamic endopeptidase [Flavobacteriales bacterium]